MPLTSSILPSTSPPFTLIMTAKRPTLKELMFRSTIYDRHEKRRAKTLLRKSDSRPAVLRVFFPPVMTATAEAAAKGSATNDVESSSPVHLEPSVPTMEDDSVFTLHDVPPMGVTGAVGTTTSSIPSVLASVLASSIGAIFSEAVYGARCLSVASPFATAGNSTTRGVPAGPMIRTTGQPNIVWYPEQATLMMQSTLSQDRRPGFFQGVSHAQLLSRAAPVAVLFGVKSTVEHILSFDKTKEAPPPVAVSIIASAVSGGILGTLRSVVPSSIHPNGGALSIVGREMAGATLYFAAYGGVKHLVLGNNKANHPTKDDSLNPLVTLMAGATAGVLYDGVRFCPQFTALEAPLTKVPTRSMMMLVRSAPSHALLFLGYEATLRLFR